MKAMLAHTYTDQNVNGWFMSQKFDGFRALWTGIELISRSGNKYPAPEWFVSQLPEDMPLDGELYIAGCGHDQVNSVIKKLVPVDAEWLLIKYFVFDAPAVRGPLEKRLESAAKTLEDNKVASVVPQYICRGDHKEFLKKICSAGGEGVILRKPGSVYTEARSMNMLKYKPDHETLFELVKEGITCLNYQKISYNKKGAEDEKTIQPVM